MDGAYLCCGCPSCQNKTKGRQNVVVNIKLMPRFLKLWWLSVQMKNFCSIASQSSTCLEPQGKDVLYHLGAKSLITLAVGLSWLWDPNSGRRWQGRSTEGQDFSLVRPRNFQPCELSVRGPGTAGRGCWAGASWPVTLSFHTVVCWFDTIVTIKKKSEKW